MLNPGTGGPSCGGPVEDEARQGLKINLDGALSVPSGWREILSSEMEKPYLQDLQDFLFTERQTHTIYPREDEVFAALELTPFDRVKVLLLGQDPYHGPEQAHGLCFSVKPGVKIPASLRNTIGIEGGPRVFCSKSRVFAALGRAGGFNAKCRIDRSRGRASFAC
jgi:hypothetical protein